MVKLGRIDITTEVLMLLSHLAYPCEGHIEAAIHVMSYLKTKHSLRLVFDPFNPEINDTDFKVCDWKEFYGDVKEAIPDNAPDPPGQGS